MKNNHFIKTIVFFALIFSLSVILLTSCSIIGNVFGEGQNSRTRYLDYVTDRNERDYEEIMLSVFEAINKNDKDELKALFAVNVVDGNPDFDNQLDEFFELYIGPTVIDNLRQNHSSTSRDSGNEQVLLDGRCEGVDSETGEIRYHVFMDIYSRDDFDKNNEGIQWLEFATVEAHSSDNYVCHTRWNSDPGLYYQDSTEKRDDIMFVDGRSWRYTYYDRTLTADTVRTIVEENDDFDYLITIIGEPNCAWDIYEYYYYELSDGLWAVVKLDHDVRPRNYYSNGELVELNLYRPNSIVAVYIADEESNLETVWMADDVAKVIGSYYYFTPIDRTLTEDNFTQFMSRSNSYDELINEIGSPDIEARLVTFFKLSDGRYILCDSLRDNIESLTVVDSERRLYTLWSIDS